jgi:putative hydrolase of the HAD superfamily
LFPPDLEAVLFDAGGVLVGLDYAFIAETARARGLAVDHATLAHAEAAARHAIDAAASARGSVGGTDATRVPSYFESLMRAAGADDLGARRIAYDLRAEHGARSLWRVPLPGVADTLLALRRAGLRTAVVSNADGRVAGSLAELGLAAHFDAILDSYVEGVEKPDPEIFRRAVSRLGVSAARCAFVGDIYAIDALGARAAGIAPVLVDVTGAYGAVDCPTIAHLAELVVTLEASR